MTQSLHAIVWYLFIIWLPNLMRAMHVYLTSTSSMCKTHKLGYQWHATQCLSYSSWSHVAHVEALSRPPCVDWSHWRAAGSRRMYSSSLRHTGGTCTKRWCARTHSFPRTHTRVHEGGGSGAHFCTKIHPMWYFDACKILHFINDRLIQRMQIEWTWGRKKDIIRLVIVESNLD